MSSANKNHLFTCRNCGSRFAPFSTGGICPYCKDANPALIDMANKYARKQQKLKKQLKKAAFRISILLIVLVAVIVSAVLIISAIVKSLNSLVFNVEEPENSPFFYTDSENKLYYCFDGKEHLIGKGALSEFAYSEKNKVTYAVFSGSENTDLDANGQYLLKITDNGEKIERIAETNLGSLTFIQGGNCEYIYYMIEENLGADTSSSYLYLYNTSEKEAVKIDEFSTEHYFKNFRISPNGKYLLYKDDDDSGTKLMKYSAKTGEKQALGIKNAEPVTIDNKGEYYSYIKSNEQNGLASFFIESNSANRSEVELPSAYIDRIVVSSDCRSFIIDSGSIRIIKDFEKDSVELPLEGTVELGINCYKDLTRYDESVMTDSKVVCIELCKNQNFLPYIYLHEDADGTSVMYCNVEDEEELVESGLTQFCTNGVQAAFISEGDLYTMQLDIENPEIKLTSEKFGNYRLSAISENGKYIFFCDEDDNLIRIPFKYNGSDWENSVIDPDKYVPSSDGKMIMYISSGVLNYSKGNKALKVADDVIENSTYVISNAKKAFCLASSESSKAEGSYSLYYFNGKKALTVADNVKEIYASDRFAVSNSNCTVYERMYAPSPYNESNEQNDAEDTDEAA